MRLARVVFTLAGASGLLLLLPAYFLEGWVARNQPPAITHPEHYYGFIGVAVAWQVAFLVIGRDPVRFRPLMAVAVLEKLGFGLPVLLLWLGGRVAGDVLALGLVDLTLGLVFAVCYVRLATPQPTR